MERISWPLEGRRSAEKPPQVHAQDDHQSQAGILRQGELRLNGGEGKEGGGAHLGKKAEKGGDKKEGMGSPPPPSPTLKLAIDLIAFDIRGGYEQVMRLEATTRRLGWC